LRNFELFSVTITLLFAGICCANQPKNQGNNSVQLKSLPPPTISATPIMQAFQKRETSRAFSSRQLDRQSVSNLLWAAYGINRPESGKRTAPSAHDWQYIDIYVADSEGLYKFNAATHDADLVKSGDIRAEAGGAHSPLNFIYVSDERRMMDRGLSAEDKNLYAAITTGAIVQNVYLYCAAAKLNTGVRGDIDRAALSKTIGLSAEQKIQMAQSIGYPPTLGSLKQGIKSLLQR
jgi:nitroreductase